jgi:Uma2 family endonuclease
MAVMMTTKPDAPATSDPVTADQLLQLPDHGTRYELVKGDLIEMSPASPRHGRIANMISFLLTQYVRQQNLGVVYAAETGFKLQENPDTVRAADAAFVAQARIPAGGEPEGYWAIAPDLVVEVVSPSDSALLVQGKVTDWLAAGCRLVWVLYPDTRTVTEYSSLADVRVLTATETLDGADVLPGFTCPIADLFA